MNDEQCRPAQVDGQVVRVRGECEMTERDREMFAEVVRAAKAEHLAQLLYETEPPISQQPWRNLSDTTQDHYRQYARNFSERTGPEVVAALTEHPDNIVRRASALRFKHNLQNLRYVQPLEWAELTDAEKLPWLLKSALWAPGEAQP